MNWKLVATLLIGAVLVTACGSGGQTSPAAAPVSPGAGAATRGAEEEKPAEGAAAAAPDAQPAGAAKPTDVKPEAKPEKKKDIVVHE